MHQNIRRSPPSRWTLTLRRCFALPSHMPPPRPPSLSLTPPCRSACRPEASQPGMPAATSRCGGFTGRHWTNVLPSECTLRTLRKACPRSSRIRGTSTVDGPGCQCLRQRKVSRTSTIPCHPSCADHGVYASKRPPSPAMSQCASPPISDYEGVNIRPVHGGPSACPVGCSQRANVCMGMVGRTANSNVEWECRWR